MSRSWWSGHTAHEIGMFTFLITAQEVSSVARKIASYQIQSFSGYVER